MRCKINGTEVVLTQAELAEMPQMQREQVAVWDAGADGWIRVARFTDTGESFVIHNAHEHLAAEHDPVTGRFMGDGAGAPAAPKPAHERKPITHEKLVQMADGLRAAVRSAHGNAVADHELKHWLAEALVHRGVTMGTAEKAAKESSQQRADKLAERTTPAEAEKALRDFETRTNAEKDAWRASKTGKATKASAIGDDVPVALDYNPNQARGADGKWGEGEIAAQKAAIAHAEAKRVASMEASGNAQFASRNAESDTRRVANNERAVVSHQAAATAARESAAAWRAVPGGPVSEVQMSPNRPPVTFDHLAREKDISAKSHDALAARHADNAVKIGVAEAAHAKAVETTANADRKAAEARDSRPRDLSSNLSAAAVAHTEAAAAHEQARVAQEGARLFKQAAESATKASEHQADAAHAATKAIQEPSAIIPSNPDDRAKTREEADGLSRMTEHYDKAAARADGLVAGIPGHADPTEHAAALGRVAGAHDVAAHWHNEAALDHRATGNDAKAAEHDAAAAAHVAASEKLKGDAERLLGKEQPRAYVAVPAVNPVRVGNGSVDPNERHEFFEHTNADGTTERLAKNVIGTISNIGRNKVEAAAMIRAIQEHPSVHAMLERHPLQELAFARISARATYIAGASYDVRTTRNIVSGEVTAREVRVVMNTAVKDEKDVTNPKYGVPLDPGKTLTVSRASSSFEESRQISLMHELGHHLQEAPGVSEHVDRGWDNRPKGFGGAISEYATKNRDEYFAESFAAYQYHNEALKEHDPNGHRMIENSLKHVGAIK